MTDQLDHSSFAARAEAMRAEAMQNYTAAARSMRELGALTTRHVGSIENALDAERGAAFQAEEKRKAATEATTESIKSFTRTLPSLRWYNDFTATLDRGYRLESDDIAKVRLAEASLWWVKIDSPTSSLRETEDWKREVGKHGSAKLPMWMVGERIGRPNGKGDAEVDLLLAPAFSGGENFRFLRATTSLVEKEAVEQMSLDKLGQPIVDPSQLYKYGGAQSERYQLSKPYGDDVRVLRLPIFGGMKLHKVPTNEAKQEKFNAGLQEKLERESLRINNPYPVVIDPSALETFDIPVHTNRLAILFGQEEAYQEMADKLATLQQQ